MSTSSSNALPASARVFSIPELLSLILDHLDRKTLASIASTCRSFHSAAVPRVWEVLDSSNIECLLDIMFVGEDDLFMKQCVKDDSSTSERWERFLLYSALVRDLHFTGPLDHVCQKLQSLSTLLPSGGWLFPNLRRLLCRVTITREQIDALSVLLCPSLSIFAVIFGVEEEAYLSPFLHKLADTAKDLVECEIWLPDSASPAVTSAYKEVVALPLRKLSSGPMQPDVFAELAQSRTLSELELSWITRSPNMPVWNGALPSHVALPFSFLSIAKFMMPVHSVSVILQSLANASLREIDFVLTPAPGPSEPALEQLLLQTVRSFAKSLEAVHLLLDSLPPNARLSLSAFDPLLSSPLIKKFTLSLESDALLDIQDAHVQAMSLAWPLLEVLKFDWYSSYHAHGATGGLVAPVRLTLNGLVPLARHCPNLLELKLTYFDASGDVPMPPENVWGSALQQLRVDYATIDSVGTVSLFISLVWPSARVHSSFVPAHHTPAFRHFKKWELVTRILRAIEAHGKLVDDSLGVGETGSLSVWTGSMDMESDDDD